MSKFKSDGVVIWAKDIEPSFNESLLSKRFVNDGVSRVRSRSSAGCGKEVMLIQRSRKAKRRFRE